MNKHNFGYSLGIYFKYSTDITFLSKDIDEHT